MFELTISTCKSKSGDISYILEKLRGPIKNMKGVLVCEEFDGRVKLALAVCDEKKDYLLSLVFDAISEAIIRDYKEEYLSKHLRLKINSKVTESAFIRALTMFDKSADKEIIKKSLTVSDEILIDSLYHFRLWELEKRWKEIAELVSENSGYLLMSGTFMELMKFLIVTSESEEAEIHLHQCGQNVYGENSQGKQVFSFKFENGENGILSVLSELIWLAPEKIVIHNDLNLSDVTDYILTLFDGKVSVMK